MFIFPLGFFLGAWSGCGPLCCLAHLRGAGWLLTSLPPEDLGTILSMPSSTGASDWWQQGPVFPESVGGFTSMIYYAYTMFASYLPLPHYSLLSGSCREQ